MVGRRQAVGERHAEDLERRGTDNSRQWRWRCNLTLPLRVDENDFKRFRTVQRQVVCPCPRLDVVDLGGPRVDVAGRDDEVRVIGKLALSGVTALRSPALTTYDAGPMLDPWMMLAVIDFSVDV